MREILEWLRRWMVRLTELGGGKQSLKRLQVLQEMGQELADLLLKGFEERLVVAQLGYEETMQWFHDHRPADARVKKGALIRARSDQQGWAVTQVFLDERNELVLKPDGAPFGRRIMAKTLDTELEELFDDQNMVVVE